MKYSGLQKEVLSLYRRCLRESMTLDKNARSQVMSYARSEFERSINLDKKDFATIEYLLRKGRRRLDTFSTSGTKIVYL
ncbi:Complex 1 protein (LYR family) [Blumeria hordei DH14]|uniref:Complex 1 protein (LYR family) n=1 Tax=Blumeria graminis f. sp. hordei (strain DH14) TaxID=546991 RepID=N1J9C2_BLUG1|nr:Complex 1 protein (LYR family) [Blumeria hordei DH14]